MPSAGISRSKGKATLERGGDAGATGSTRVATGSLGPYPWYPTRRASRLEQTHRKSSNSLNPLPRSDFHVARRAPLKPCSSPSADSSGGSTTSRGQSPLAHSFHESPGLIRR